MSARANTPKPKQPAAWIRRQRMQRQVALQRAAVRDAWASFEQASVVAQAKVHRVIDLARSLSLIAGAVVAAIALWRAAQGRTPPRPAAVRVVALASVLRRIVPVARRLLASYP